MLRDYAPQPTGAAGEARPGRAGWPGCTADELLDLAAVAAAIGLAPADGLDRRVSARGYRLLGRIPRLPPRVRRPLVEHFGGLQKLLSASASGPAAGPRSGPALATSVREGWPGWPSRPCWTATPDSWLLV